MAGIGHRVGAIPVHCRVSGLIGAGGFLPAGAGGRIGPSIGLIGHRLKDRVERGLECLASIMEDLTRMWPGATRCLLDETALQHWPDLGVARQGVAMKMLDRHDLAEDREMDERIIGCDQPWVGEVALSVCASARVVSAVSRQLRGQPLRVSGRVVR